MYKSNIKNILFICMKMSILLIILMIIIFILSLSLILTVLLIVLLILWLKKLRAIESERTLNKLFLKLFNQLIKFL